MKPQNLTARNFRSYPELEIPMSGIQLATLCGENGAGKSSVLKAMLFGLFGAEPGLSLDDYIRRGETEARVEFIFALIGNTYRVIRTIKSKHTLEFALKNGDKWETLTGDTIAQTQQRINETLCLDQDGFLKSAWISQGDADAFTRAKPTERKGVFASILNLEIWKRLQDAAKKRLRAIEDDITKVRGALVYIDGELERKGQAVVDLRAARDKAQTYEYGVKKLETEKEKLFEEEKRFLELRIHHEDLKKQKQAAINIDDEMDGKISSRNVTIKSQQALADSAEELDQKMERRDQLVQTIADLEETANRWNETNQKRLELRSQYQEVKAVVDVFVTERSNTQREADKVDKDLAVVEAKLVELSTETAHNCPICKQEIKDQALVETGKVYEVERQKGNALVQELSQKLASLDLKVEQGNEPLAKLVEQADQLPTIEYDQGAHDGMKRELEGMNGIETRLAEARGAATRIIEIQSEIDGFASHRESWKIKREKIEEQLLAMADDLKKANESEAAAEEIIQKTRNARKDLDDANASVTRLEAEIERLKKLADESADDRKRQDELHATAATWRYLVEAFGKDGIPALIIDAAISEVEDIANDILTRLGTGLEVKLETQKALKSSDRIAETLDVKIIEDGFDRPYETYSGGEAYRVNVALRVALSKLLARRAGAHIETLILDEPEGLDEEGRAKLVELLQILSETFSTILLISHHEDLREVFPARIECSKGPEGSSAEVVMA
ncbi:MAG: SMC family ATPase [Thermoleophilia bacterium]